MSVRVSITVKSNHDHKASYEVITLIGGASIFRGLVRYFHGPAW